MSNTGKILSVRDSAGASEHLLGNAGGIVYSATDPSADYHEQKYADTMKKRHKGKHETKEENKQEVKSLKPINSICPRKPINKEKNKVAFPKFRYYHRFHHTWVEVRRKITNQDVVKYIENNTKDKENDQKADDQEEDVKTIDRGFSSLDDSFGTMPTQPAMKLQRSLTSAVANKEWRSLNIIDLRNEEALDTAKSGHYTYFEPGVKRRRIAFFDGKMKRVSKINTCEETFHIVFHFYATWLMSYDEVLRMKAAMKANNGEVKDDWKPKSYPIFECANKVDGEMKRVSKFKLKDGAKWPTRLANQDPGKHFKHDCHPESGFDIDTKKLGFHPIRAYYCRVQYECQFTCAEEMELEMFPFDCQDLSTYLRLKQKANEWDVLPLPRHGEIFNINARFSMVSEWKIPGVLLEFEQGDPKLAKDGIGYNSVIIRVKAERKWQSHITDSFVIFCMFWLGLVTFGIPVDDVGDRLAYCITLLLTDVASMQLLNETTPNIPYRTFLDTYTLSCFGYLVGITAWVTIEGWHGSALLGPRKGWIAFIVFVCVALAIHIYFIYRIVRGNKLEQSKLTMDSKGLDEFFNCLSHVASMPTAGVYWDSHTIDENENKKEEDEGSWCSLSYPWQGYPQSRKEYFSK